MADYIKREDVYKAIENAGEGNNGFLADEIDAIPSADVVEVKHGEWIEKETFHDENADVISEWQSARCSVCNKYHTTPYLYCFTDYNFCPSCGARMEGGT